MAQFALEHGALTQSRERAAIRADSGEAGDLFASLGAGERLEAEALTALFLSRDLATEDLFELARSRRAAADARIETFSPLYLSNECDAECAMCGMRRFNQSLRRSTADGSVVAAQLDILHRRGLRGVAILTGEYHRGPVRQAMIARAASALHAALERDFSHVLINIGSLEQEEYATLLADVPRRDDGTLAPQVTMCTFQETYDPRIYRRFMGSTRDNPRSDFTRRLQNFDRAAGAGMRFANPGILLGLNRDLAYELLALLAHLRHLSERGMVAYVSLPRLQKASGTAHRAGTSDDDLVRIVALLSAGVPEARVVISTREAPAIQRRLLPVIDVLTAGSPGVAPYTEAGARFDVEASQFEVLDHRSIETILGECLAAGTSIDCYEPSPSA